MDPRGLSPLGAHRKNVRCLFMVTMTATVVQAWGSQVLVRDNSNGQEVLALTG